MILCCSVLQPHTRRWGEVLGVDCVVLARHDDDQCFDERYDADAAAADYSYDYNGLPQDAACTASGQARCNGSVADIPTSHAHHRGTHGSLSGHFI